MALEWRGEQVKAALQRAGAEGINETMKLAVKDAQANHGPNAHAANRFESQTGELARNIQVIDRAAPDRRGAGGKWGVRGVPYAATVELRFPFLRPSLEAHYPLLAGRVRKAGRFA